MIPEIKDGLLLVPHGGDGGNLYLNLGDLAKVEVRLQEIETVTKLKAPELLSAFTSGWKDIHQNVVTVQAHLVLCKRELERTKAVVLLDKVPTVLKEKGLVSDKRSMGSEDLRNAVLSLDPDLQKCQEKFDYLECVLELLKGKLKSIQMGYEAVKKILGETSYLDNLGEIHGTSSESYEANGFGKPRY